MHKYYLIYKPFQVLSQFSSEGEKLCLKDYFSVEKDVYPVGRLDYDSEGLLLLTNDTSLNKKLLHPTYAHQRTYWVQVDGNISETEIEKLINGTVITVEGKQYKTLPCKAAIFTTAPNVPERNPPIRFRKNIPAPWISITLTEGKNRQVRKMTAAVGFPTLRLIRHSMEALTIDGMMPGDIKQITLADILNKS